MGEKMKFELLKIKGSLYAFFLLLYQFQVKFIPSLPPWSNLHLKLVLVSTIFSSIPARATDTPECYLGKVSEYSGDDGNYRIHFKQVRMQGKLTSGCKEFDVAIVHETTPWYAWMPFVETTHPTKEETLEAASFLEAAAKGSREIYFGYVGNGLELRGRACLFSSHGIIKYNDRGRTCILSFFDEVDFDPRKSK